MRDAVIVEAVRTPVGKGKPGGAYSEVHPVELHAHAIRSVVERVPGLRPHEIDDVIGGVVGQVGEQSGNTTRFAAITAGLPESVPGVTVDRQCGSSQQALSFAAQGVIAGAYDIAVASGVESMSHVPIGSSALVDGVRQDVAGPAIPRIYPGGLIPQGVSAELIARKWGLSRAQLDEFSATSHQRAAAAWDQGFFAGQVAPLKVTRADGTVSQLDRDETIRPGTTLEGLAALNPVREEGRVTAGNASQNCDCAAALLVVSERALKEHGLTPRARIHHMSVRADNPVWMLTGPINATRYAMQKSGMKLDDIDLFECNEAFASVPMAWMKELGIPHEKVNVQGGAIALGHPIGSTGARLMTTLLNTLERTGGRYGLQTMCEGGGQANVTIIERL